MASNAFGNQFRFSTFGESHGKAIGVVIDGCPAGLPLDEEEVAAELLRRIVIDTRGLTSEEVASQIAQLQSCPDLPSTSSGKL